MIERNPYPDSASVLAVNAGSSSIRFALYEANGSLLRRGKIERITDHGKAASELIDSLDKDHIPEALTAVGHRVVHGGIHYSAAVEINDTLLQELRRISAYSPEHLPAEIDLIERFRQRLPAIRHVACFDTAFHHDMPRVAQLLPIPRRFNDKGIRRFGFHGLSCAFLMEELERLAGREAAQRRIVIAHLGNGSSLTAVYRGKSIDTTMALTPTAGIPMSTRSGDLDPGLGWYLTQTENVSPQEFHRMVNHESGLLGISQTSSDMRDLLAREAGDVRAAEAIEMYCYHVAKAVGALAVAQGGLDTLIFSGGIGENAPVIRQRICDRLAFLGPSLDVRVIATDEETMIARTTQRMLL